MKQLPSILKIEDWIPHRRPMLLLDGVQEIDSDRVEANFLVEEEAPYLQGHYPNFPLVPGVILCEAIFQAGALLLSWRSKSQVEVPKEIPVISRIYHSKFKQMVRPPENVKLRVELTEQAGAAFRLKGRALVQGEVACVVEFGCTARSI